MPWIRYRAGQVIAAHDEEGLFILSEETFFVCGGLLVQQFNRWVLLILQGGNLTDDERGFAKG